MEESRGATGGRERVRVGTLAKRDWSVVVGGEDLRGEVVGEGGEGVLWVVDELHGGRESGEGERERESE